MENLNQRISKIIEYSRLTSSEFADAIEVQRSSISHITSGRNKPSLEFIIKIKNKFPELSWDWMINGEGEMTKADEEKEETLPNPKPATLPDLFSLINDDNFGKTDSDDEQEKETLRDFPIPVQTPAEEKISDSQPLDFKENKIVSEHIENQHQRIKRIVLFFENGKFESFEP